MNGQEPNLRPIEPLVNVESLVCIKDRLPDRKRRRYQKDIIKHHESAVKDKQADDVPVSGEHDDGHDGKSIDFCA